MKGSRMRAWLVGMGMLLATLAADVWAAAEVRSVRLWRAPDNTRLVFDLSGPAQHNIFTLSAPERIVIDISGAQLRTPLEQLALGNTPITSLRSAQRTPEDLRLVLDLSKTVTPKSFTLAPNQQYGHRLVIDLFDEGASPVQELPPSKVASGPQVPVSPAKPATKVAPPPASRRHCPCCTCWKKMAIRPSLT